MPHFCGGQQNIPRSILGTNDLKPKVGVRKRGTMKFKPPISVIVNHLSSHRVTTSTRTKSAAEIKQRVHRWGGYPEKFLRWLLFTNNGPTNIPTLLQKVGTFFGEGTQRRCIKYDFFCTKYPPILKQAYNSLKVMYTTFLTVTYI